MLPGASSTGISSFRGRLASQNHYPAIDILRSNSRLMPYLIGRDQMATAGKIRELLSTYESMEDLINIGAYVAGSQEKIDLAIEKREPILEFLRRNRIKNIHGKRPFFNGAAVDVAAGTCRKKRGEG